MDGINNLEMKRLLENTEADQRVLSLTDKAHTVAELKKILETLHLMDKSLSRKADLCIPVAKIYTEPRLFEYLMECLGERAGELIRACTWDGMLDGLKAPGEALPATFYLKQNSRGEIYIEAPLQELFRDHLSPPSLKTPYQWKELPPEGIFTAKQGEEFYRQLPALLIRLQDLGFFRRNPDAKILKGTLKTLTSEGGISPFPFEEPGEYSRLSLILHFLSFTLSGDESELPLPPADVENPAEFLKNSVADFFSSPRANLDLSTLLPEIKFSSRSWYLHSSREHRKTHMPYFALLFRHWRFDNWVDIESCLTIFYRTSTARPLMPDRDMHYIEDVDHGYGTVFKDKNYIYSELDYINRVYKPYFRRLFLLGAALGLFELCRNEEYTALRMTELGRWVFGLNDSFKAVESAPKQAVRLDKRFLTAYADPADRAAVSFFKTIGSSLGQGVFKISGELMLRGCPAKADLEARFSALLRHSGGSLPPLWESFKEGLMSRYICLNREEDWVVYDLSEYKGALTEYLNSMNSPLFTRMEGLKIGVREENVRSFHKLLKKGGFYPGS